MWREAAGREVLFGRRGDEAVEGGRAALSRPLPTAPGPVHPQRWPERPSPLMGIGPCAPVQLQRVPLACGDVKGSLVTLGAFTVLDSNLGQWGLQRSELPRQLAFLFLTYRIGTGTGTPKHRETKERKRRWAPTTLGATRSWGRYLAPGRPYRWVYLRPTAGYAWEVHALWRRATVRGLR